MNVDLVKNERGNKKEIIIKRGSWKKIKFDFLARLDGIKKFFSKSNFKVYNLRLGLV